MSAADTREQPRKQHPVRLSMDLPPQVHYDLKREALARDTSITHVVTELIEDLLYSDTVGADDPKGT